MPPFPLLLGVERVLRLIVKLVLQTQAVVVSLDSANNVCDRLDPPVHLKFTQFAGGEGSIARVMIRETRVPPDTGIDVVWQINMVLIRARFGRCSIHVYQIWTRDQHFSGLALSGVHVELVRPRRAST